LDEFCFGKIKEGLVLYEPVYFDLLFAVVPKREYEKDHYRFVYENNIHGVAVNVGADLCVRPGLGGERAL
jgi:hypothetical protein